MKLFIKNLVQNFSIAKYLFKILFFFFFTHRMQESIHEFQKYLKKEDNCLINEHLKDILDKFEFIYYPDILQSEKKAKQYESNSKIIVIDEYMEDSIKYYILCFDYKLIILPQEDNTDDLILPSIFTRFEDSNKYFIQNCYTQFETDTRNENFFNEIRNFSKEFMISNEKVQHFWSIVVNCLSGFLIKKGYQNSLNKHEKYLNDDFVEYKEEHSRIVDKSYIKLRDLGQGSGGRVELIFHISKEEIFALKIPYIESHLNIRERRNYLSIRFPFIVPYIGYIKFANKPKYLLLEYVEGESLDKYQLNNLNDQEKYTIILELLLTICYLHSLKYVYRDLRLSNIMINQNKDAILIDFDHVRKENDETEDDVLTDNFCDQAVALEKKKTYKSDVYSLGYIIHYILYGKSPIMNDKTEINENFIFKSCLENDPTERPNIIMMTIQFLAKTKFEGKKVLHLISLVENQNFPEINFILGFIYNEGKYVTQDISKAIHYFSLAANQNHPGAQFNLGVIYDEGKYVTRDINKAIHYYSLAANQNISEAQFNLGFIYFVGQYIEQNTKKGSYYIMLASINNNREFFLCAWIFTS